MLLITFGGYVLCDDDGDGLMDMQCCSLQSVGICCMVHNGGTLLHETTCRSVLAPGAIKNGKTIPIAVAKQILRCAVSLATTLESEKQI